MGDTGARAIARNPHLGRLRQLDYGNNLTSAKGLRELALSPTLLDLVRLRLFEIPQSPWRRARPNDPTPRRAGVFRLDPETTRLLSDPPLKPHVSIVELEGYEFPAGTLDPLLNSEQIAWFTADPRFVLDTDARGKLEARLLERGMLPPIQTFMEDDNFTES
jgi:hypothetical protein